MRRKLAVPLAVALLIFVLARRASADLITTPSGEVLIPDGSQITSVFPTIFGNCHTLGFDFRFQGGTGFTTSCFIEEGTITDITFTVPVTNLSLSLVVPDPSAETILSDGTSVLFECHDENPFEPNPIPCPGTIDLTLSGPISFLFLSSFPGFSGIESLSFAADDGDPRTSSLVLLGFGLLGLLVSFRRKVAVCP